MCSNDPAEKERVRVPENPIATDCSLDTHFSWKSQPNKNQNQTPKPKKEDNKLSHLTKS